MAAQLDLVATRKCDAAAEMASKRQTQPYVWSVDIIYRLCTHSGRRSVRLMEIILSLHGDPRGLREGSRDHPSRLDAYYCITVESLIAWLVADDAAGVQLGAVKMMLAKPGTRTGVPYVR